MITADQLLAAIRARGCNATTLRDAVHEAVHALEVDAPDGQWDRDTIHAGVMGLSLARAAASEVMARAVEQLVCADFSVDPGGTVEGYAMIACLEAAQHRIPFYDQARAVELICHTMTLPYARQIAGRVRALAANEVRVVAFVPERVEMPMMTTTTMVTAAPVAAALPATHVARQRAHRVRGAS